MTGAVGIFWMVDGVLVAAGCGLEDAARYGECLTYDGGHAEQWEAWQKAGGRWLAKNGLPSSILTTEYDEHPRGRIVKEPTGFVLYADWRLQGRAQVSAICERFGLDRSAVSVRSDPHYR